MLSFNTPSGLGIEGTTPAGLNMSTPALTGTAMMPTMSDLGLTASGGKRNEDEERRGKMRNVLKSIGKSKGRVSEEGIARVSRRVGFANDIDAEKLTQEEKERKVGNRTISTAGNSIVIEVNMKNDVPRNVQVMYSVQNKALDEQAGKASEVLLDDLKAPNGVALNAKLDRFALNLDRLAKIDRLSSHGVNCFEALSGVYSSLSRLYEQELQAARSVLSSKETSVDEEAKAEVMCKRSGKPMVHPRGRLGLELAYWRTNRHLSAQSRSKPDSSAMDMDEQVASEDDTAALQDEDQTYTLRVEAEVSPAGMYPSLRVSDSWLPDPLELPGADSGEGVPWQDPPPTFVTPSAAGDAMAVDGPQNLPDLRFIAKLDPPVKMPYQTAMNVLAAVGMPVPPMIAMPPQYAALLLDPSAATHTQTQSGPFTMTAENKVLSQIDGQETTVYHKSVLNSVKLDWAFKAEEIPFSHPRQLIELLPTLRQWACVGSLLKDVFEKDGRSPTGASSQIGADHINGLNNGLSKLDEVLSEEEPSVSNGKVPINYALATSPTPTLGITFPTSGYKRVANVNVRILSNADIAVTSHEGLAPGDNSHTGEEARKLAKALDVCGDLGVWVEWMRTRSTS